MQLTFVTSHSARVDEKREKKKDLVPLFLGRLVANTPDVESGGMKRREKGKKEKRKK